MKTQEEFEKARDYMKNQFFGIDNVIDEIFDIIRIWYLSPHLLKRPLVVNLWGMTGVGKTDLVRKISNALGISNNRFEVNFNDNIYDKRDDAKASLLEEGFLNRNEQGILLIDEFHKLPDLEYFYRPNGLFQLLSEGRFQTPSQLLRRIEYNFIPWLQNKEIQAIENAKTDLLSKLNNETKSFDRFDFQMEMMGSIFGYGKYKMTPYKLRNLFCISDFLEIYYDFLNVTQEKIPRIIEASKEIYRQECNNFNKFEDYKIFEENLNFYFAKQNNEIKIRAIPTRLLIEALSDKVDEIKNNNIDLDKIIDTTYSKLLIFVCGNLDTMYTNSKVIRGDVDDIRRHTLKLNISDVKKSLMLAGFKPEEVSRLGNIHIIYSSLDKESYLKIIGKELKEYNDTLKKEFGVDINLHKRSEIVSFIYEIGVDPSQGARPTISAVSQFMNKFYPDIIMRIKEYKEKGITEVLPTGNEFLVNINKEYINLILKELVNIGKRISYSSGIYPFLESSSELVNYLFGNIDINMSPNQVVELVDKKILPKFDEIVSKMKSNNNKISKSDINGIFGLENIF